MNKYPICNACGSEDSRVCNGDNECCTECGTSDDFRWVEQIKPFTIKYWLELLLRCRKEMDHWIKHDIITFNKWRRRFNFIYNRIISKYGE